MNTTPNIIFFDGHCGLCDRWVQFVLKADRSQRFLFAPLQPQDLAQADSVMLRLNGRVYLRSEAVLHTLGHLGHPYRLALILRYVPLRFRDAVYDLVARNRHRWFGRRTVCPIPTATEAARLLP